MVKFIGNLWHVVCLYINEIEFLPYSLVLLKA